MFTTQNNRSSYRGSYPIGDRVVVNSIGSIEKADGGYDVSVSYLDHSVNQAMAETPTEKKTATFTVINHRIVTSQPEE